MWALVIEDREALFESGQLASEWITGDETRRRVTRARQDLGQAQCVRCELLGVPPHTEVRRPSMRGDVARS
jgi:hypothetical protein